MRSYFTRIRGADAVKSRIGTAIENRRLPHALLLDGPRGSGKHTLAIEIAAALNCESRTSPAHPLPCGECNACRRIREGSFTDVKELKLDGDRASIGVAQIKDFRADMFLSATESEHKIYIIRDAEKMTVEAQNALLIVLEEPPKGVVTLLLANGTDKILTTIKSRAQYVGMPRLSEGELREHLLSTSDAAKELAQRDDTALNEAILSADGCVGIALEALSPASVEENRARKKATVAFLRATSRRAPYKELYDAQCALPTKRQELSDALEDITVAIRDMIVLRTSANAKLCFFTSREQAEELCRIVGPKRLFPLYDIINTTHADNAKNANISALLTAMTAKIRAI